MINTVRLAMPAEAADVARIQRRAWGAQPNLAVMLEEVRADQATQLWHAAITRPPLATMRVLVALGEAGIVGFAVTKPSDDPDATPTDGELAELVVDPDARTQGHGSRLMQAAVDTLRTDGFTVATMWVPTTDDTMHEFLISGGWGADGAHREAATDDGEHSLKLTRFHTSIA